MKLKQHHETNVYISVSGYICIKQVSFEHDEATIVLAPWQAEQIAKHIIESGILFDAQEAFDAEDTP